MDSTSELSVLHWNCRSISPKLDHLIHFIYNSTCSIDIILLNETWLGSNSNIKIKGYNIIRRDSDRPHGGIAIAVKSNIDFKLINTASTYHFQNILVSLKIGSFCLDIMSVYCPPPPNGKFNIQSLSDSFSKLTSRNYLVIGDFNAHNFSWGSRKNDARGNNIQSFMENLHCVCLNDHDITTLAPFGQEGNVLDLVFSSSALSSSCSFSVLNDPMSSNHYPILVNVSYRSGSIQSPTVAQPPDPPTNSINSSMSEINFNKINWNEFTINAELAYSSFQLSDNPITDYNNFIQCLCDILLKFPKKYLGKKSRHRKALIWWNSTCDKAVCEARLALDSYKRYPSQENYLIYKEIDARKKKILLEQKRQSWYNLCTSFNRCTPSKIIWDHIRKFKFSKQNSNTSKSHYLHSMSNALGYLDSISSSQAVIDVASISNLFTSVGLSSSKWLLNSFDLDELLASLQNKKNSSPGPDYIPYSVIINMPMNVKKILLHIFNQVWLSKVIPESWKIQTVVPILKPNKDPNCIQSYRPISLTSCFSKVFESMLKNRLEWFIENNNIIPENQFGFRKGKSTMDNLGCLIGDIDNGFKANKNTLAVFLDFKGAFDNIDHCFLIKSLFKLNLPGPLLEWLFKFLNDRLMFLKVNNQFFGPKSNYKGTPQGSVLSPLIFILSLVTFMKEIPDHIKFLFFADDLVVYLHCNNVNDGEVIMNNCLNTLYDYISNDMKLEVNTSKSSAVFFSKHGKFSPLIMYNSEVIPINFSVKYLGMVLDSNLLWKSHIEYIFKKAELGLNIMKSLAGVKWGADPKILKLLYISTVRSHFDYGCMFYRNANNSLLRKLDVLQNKALRIITGAMMSSPINSLEVEAGIVPLFIRRAFIIDKYCLKLVSRDNSITNRFLEFYDIPNYNMAPFNIEPTISDSLTYLNYEFQDSIYWSRLLPCFQFSFNSIFMDMYITVNRFNSKFDFLEFIDTKQDYIKIYTDGSKSKDRTSFAFYDSFQSLGQVFKCNNAFSIYSAEILGMIYAVEYITSQYHNKQKKFLILSDSMSALQALQNKSINASQNYLVYKLRLLVLNLKNSDVQIEFIWVPGHSGILGNELVDTLAKSSDNVTDTECPVPFTDLTLFIKTMMLKRWSLYLDSTRQCKGKWLEAIAPSPSTKAWFERDSNYLGREFISTLCRLRIGHCKIPSHLYRLKLVDSASCTYCNTNTICDLQHLFFVCPKFNLDRLFFICQLQDFNVPIPNNVQTLLKDSQLYVIVYKFICNTIGRI